MCENGWFSLSRSQFTKCKHINMLQTGARVGKVGIKGVTAQRYVTQ